MENIDFWHWWVAAALFGALEIFLPGAVFLWLGVSAGVMGLVLLAVPTLPWQTQVLVFSVLSVGAVVGWRLWARAHPVPSDHPTLNRRGAQYVGRLLVLESPIVNHRGRAFVDDTLWPVQGAEDLPAGVTVRVVGTEGTVLRVERG
ncbi:MAG TPA: NfeD family protein [Azospirillaceae bacterium]|nr:NfeD family protein [Azospirillaceae bacterium]